MAAKEDQPEKEDGRRFNGRQFGVPNRDKIELRALLQEKVLEFTTLKAGEDAEKGLPPDQRQQVIEEYDPVVAMALVAVDRSTPLDTRVRCNAEVAQYVRPKLKSVEMTTDDATLSALSQKTETTEMIMNVLTKLAAGSSAKPGGS